MQIYSFFCQYLIHFANKNIAFSELGAKHDIVLNQC